MRLTVIITALGLGACTTTPAMQTALAPLTGQPVERVVAQLGPPTSATPIGADTVYQWHRARTVHGAPMRATTTGAPALPVHLAAAPMGAIRTSQSCIERAASIPAVRDSAMSRARSDR